MPKIKGGKPSLRDKRAKTTRSASKEVAVISPAKARVIEAVGVEGEKRLRMTKKRIKALQELTSSEFKGDLGNIFDIIDGGGTPEQIQAEFLRGALAMLVNTIPKLEESLHTDGRESNAYALNSIVSQCREIINELRSLSDSQNVAFTIATNVIDPVYMAMTNTFLQMMVNFGETISPYVKDEHKFRVRETIQTVARGYGEYLMTSRQTVKDQILANL